MAVNEPLKKILSVILAQSIPEVNTRLAQEPITLASKTLNLTMITETLTEKVYIIIIQSQALFLNSYREITKATQALDF